MTCGDDTKIILTGFEPFGGMDKNPSWDGVSLVPDTISNNKGEQISVIKLRLPVVFSGAFELLKDKIISVRPSCVICTGLAASRSDITPEVIAVNVMSGRIADNSGFRPDWEKIDPCGPDGLFSTLPYREMVSAVNALGISSSLSFSAGTFVCNDLFYRLMKYAVTEDNARQFKAGFIHVPDIDPGLIAKALCECVRTVSSLPTALLPKS